MRFKETVIAFLILICIFAGGCGTSSQPSVLRVAIPYSDSIQDFETNYYINWLEEKTGLNLDIYVIRQTRSEEYLEILFSSEADIDVVFFGGDFTIEEEKVREYADRGLVYREGDRYFYENYGTSMEEGPGQILWINREWLEKLNLKAPRTTEDFYNVLKAFKGSDLNGNGIRDEIPLIGSPADYCYMPWEFILNSFVYNDPYHSRFFTGGGSDTLAAATDNFREGLRFCRMLYREDLLDKRSFSCSLSELSELINSPVNMVGAFTTDSVSNLIYPGNTEIMARYIHLSPLEGLEQNSLFYKAGPRVGAIINGKSKRKDEAKKLLELMLTKEASLIARYGEEGVDWSYSEGQDVSIYGDVSTIVTYNYIRNTSQNKHLNGIGPMNVPLEYINGVTWNGNNSDMEYIDARARMSYKKYLPAETGRLHERDEKLSAYIDSYVEGFITGNKNTESDAEWKKYLNGLPY